jgi:hypothetical protein
LSERRALFVADSAFLGWLIEEVVGIEDRDID